MSTNLSGYLFAWCDWKEKNQQNEFPNPDNPEERPLSQYLYWRRYVWDKMDTKQRELWSKIALTISEKESYRVFRFD